MDNVKRMTLVYVMQNIEMMIVDVLNALLIQLLDFHVVEFIITPNLEIVNVMERAHVNLDSGENHVNVLNVQDFYLLVQVMVIVIVMEHVLVMMDGHLFKKKIFVNAQHLALEIVTDMVLANVVFVYVIQIGDYLMTALVKKLV